MDHVTKFFNARFLFRFPWAEDCIIAALWPVRGLVFGQR